MTASFNNSNSVSDYSSSRLKLCFYDDSADTDRDRLPGVCVYIHTHVYKDKIHGHTIQRASSGVKCMEGTVLRNM